MKRAAGAKQLILTVGLPYSGKSTWARAAGYPMVCPDTVRLGVHGERFLAAAEPFVWAVVKAMAAALFHAGHPIVIVDATNISARRRADWVDWAVQFHKTWGDTVELTYVHFLADAEECRRRALVDGDERILPVIDRMAQEFEDPQDDPWPWRPAETLLDGKAV